MTCPRCGTTNTNDGKACRSCLFPLSASGRSVKLRKIKARQSLRGLLNNKRDLVLKLSLPIVLLAMLISFGGYNQAKASAKYKDAQLQSAEGDFNGALETLRSARSYWSLPGTDRDIDKFIEKNEQWAVYLDDLNKAEELFESGDFGGAIALVKDIPDDFPITAAVEELRNRIKSALSDKATEDKSANEARKKSEPEAPARPVTPAAKRFASTAAKSNVLTAQDYSQLENALDVFLSQYSIDATFSPEGESTWGSLITWNLLGPADFLTSKSYAEQFIDEWAKYPVDFVAKSGLEEINFVKSVVVSGQSRTATYDPYQGEMYYAPAGIMTIYNAHVIHHEYAHYYEIVFKHTLNWERDAWVKHNPPGFSYGAGGATAYGASPKYISYEHPIEGFVTEYGTYGLEEDRAEIAGYLFESSEYKKLKGWMKNDARLTAKVNIYKNFLASISREMGADYFDQINP